MIALLLTKQILSMYIFLAIGFWLVRRGILKQEDGKILAIVNLNILLPCTIINAFRIEYSSEIRNNFLLSFLVSFLVHAVMFVLSGLLEKIFHLTVIENASLFYTNCGNLIIPIVAGVLGEDMVIYASSYLCVQMLWLWTYGHNRIKGVRALRLGGFLQALKNINFLAVLAGMVLFFARIPLPEPVDLALMNGSRAIPSISMVQIGIVLAGVDFGKALTSGRLYLIVVLRMIVIPLLCLAFLELCPFAAYTPAGKGLFLPIFMAASAPAAVIVSQLAQLHGQDAEHAGMINAVTTLACVVTMPLLAALYMRGA